MAAPPAARGQPSVGSAASSGGDRMASLYASLAAELREKLSNPTRGPLLLPPRDYGTVCKRSSSRPEGGSKSSSGIGSDELLPRELDSSSDEEWTSHQREQQQHRRTRRPVSFPAASAVFGQNQLPSHQPQKQQQQPRHTQTPQPYRNGQVPQPRPASQQHQQPHQRNLVTPRQQMPPDSRTPNQQQEASRHHQKRSRDYRHSFAEPTTRRALPL